MSLKMMFATHQKLKIADLSDYIWIAPAKNHSDCKTSLDISKDTSYFDYAEYKLMSSIKTFFKMSTT